MLMGSRTTVIIKIMIFSINIDKFTGFFDKFLKNNVQINDCNIRSYHTNLSVPHSDMAAKKVFWFHSICPQLPAFARSFLRLHPVAHMLLCLAFAAMGHAGFASAVAFHPAEMEFLDQAVPARLGEIQL